MKNNKKYHIRSLTYAAVIAALYVALTMVSAAMGLASGAIQLRLAEALTVLPVFTPAAIPGLALGCFISNLISGCIPADVILGTLATLLGALGTYFIGRKVPILSTIPPIVANATIVPFVLKYGYGLSEALWYFALTVGIGEIISCGIFGTALYFALKKKNLFKK